MIVSEKVPSDKELKGPPVSRYSLLYLASAVPSSDSKRARFRIGLLLEKLVSRLSNATSNTYEGSALASLIESELGENLFLYRQYGWRRYVDECKIPDLLDCITLTFKFFRRGKFPALAEEWRNETARIFIEQQLAYWIDNECIVHPAVDAEFQRSTQSTIAGLQAPRYANSRAMLQRVSNELLCDPPNGKEAWRATFAAVEGLFRLMFPSAPQLKATAIDANLARTIHQLYRNDPVALRAANRQLAALKEWIDSSHNYRHEPGSEEPVQPPIDLAVLAVSSGMGFLRWLAALDEQAKTG
jgi:hypothetical protein